MTCKNCVYNVLKTDSYDGTKFDWCDRYLDNYETDKAEKCRAYKPKTNADKIRCMTDEELANFIMEDRWDCNDCPSGQENMDNPYGGKCDNKCFEHCLDWLRKEVDGK